MEEEQEYYKKEEIKWYTIDWDKVQTIEEVKTVLKALDIRVGEKNKHLDSMKEFLNEV